MENKPNFYAIITADVRYCKALEPSAKLLYGEITALCNAEGYCWATNKYFSELYEVDERTIQRWLEALKQEGFIEVNVFKQGFDTKRHISIIKDNFTTRQKCRGREGQNCHPRDGKNVVHNTTYINNTNTPKGDIAPTAKKRQSYDIEFSFETKDFKGILEDDLASWRKLYPTVDVARELKAMTEWILGNPAKSKTKKKWRQFINIWLSKTNDKNINKEAYGAGSQQTNQVKSIYEKFRMLHDRRSNGCEISVSGEAISFIPLVGQGLPKTISFKENGAAEQINNELRKRGFI